MRRLPTWLIGCVNDNNQNQSLMRHRRSFAAITLVLSLTGCATITTGSGQAIAVNTDPEGADCTLTRDGVVLARVNPTPGSIHVEKSSTDLTVLCRRDGYQETGGKIGSEFQPATLGNIILGGIVGVVVDAASGAMTKYPTAVTFKLIPVTFRSNAERDQFYDGLAATFLREYGEVLERIARACTPENCAAQLKAADTARASRLADIERRRAAAVVNPQ